MANESNEVDQLSSLHYNPNIFELENKPKPVLGHDIGAGSPCFKCDCPGLELHYWRKLCKLCACRIDDHDVRLPKDMDHGKLIIGRLFDIIPDFERKLNLSLKSFDDLKLKDGSSPSIRSSDGRSSFSEERSVCSAKLADGYTWLPTDNPTLVEMYFRAIPEAERPIVGSQGAKYRQMKLQYQLPHYDTNAGMARTLVSESDCKQHAKYMEIVKKKVVGVAKLIECFDKASLSNSTTENTGKDNALMSGSEKSKAAAKCHACKLLLRSGEVAVVTDHGLVDEMWHPNCFCCHTCKDRLVDLIYFYKDGRYYCGRHFGDLMYTRCAGCDELIFCKEYTFAEEKNWHFDHFCCFECDEQLGGHRYMMKDEQPYCFACYMAKFARTCATCRNKIAPDEQRISYKDLHWHVQHQCFHCQKCQIGLVNRRFVLKGEFTFCSSDCKRAYFKLES